MLYKGQPVTANCREEYLCIVTEPHGELRGSVEAIAIIGRNDNLTILDEPIRQDWYVHNDFNHAEDLYAKYMKMKGLSSARKEDEPYLIRGRLI